MQSSDMEQNIQQGSSMQLSTYKRTNNSSADDEPNTKRAKLDNKYYNKKGLVYSLHGDIYQLKLLMLFLKRASKKIYGFELGTEDEDAGKFDDVVFENDSGKTRFLQVKHKQDESKQITSQNLLTVNNQNDDYSLQKYFISYREIKKKYTKLGDFILYTNIDFDLSDLQKNKIRIDPTNLISDDILSPDSTKSGKFYKIIVDKKHKLYDILKETSNFHLLANELRNIIDGKKRSLELRNDIFKKYHVALCKQVFDIILDEKNEKKYVKFRNNFKNNDQLSSEVSAFRFVLQSVLEINDYKKFREKLNSQKIAASLSFGEVFELQNDPMITDAKKLAKKFAEIISKSDDNIIKLDRRADIINHNIDKLAGHIFIKEKLEVEEKKEEDIYILRKGFFNHNEIFGNNLNNFRTALKDELRNENIDLSNKQYKFRITKFRTCVEEQLSYSEGKLIYSELHNLQNDKIEETEIDQFLNNLIFAVNQPNEIELGKIIAKELGEESQFNLLNSDVVYDSFQNKMLEWFKDKRGVYLNAIAAEKLFQEIEEKVNNLITVGLHLPYPEKLLAYGIEFQKNSLVEHLKEFLTTEHLFVLHLFSKENTLLSAIKIYNALNDLNKDDNFAQKWSRRDSYIFMRSSTLKRSETMKTLVMDAFKSSNSHNLLIINCENDEQYTFLNLKKLLKKYKNKKVILLTMKNQALTERLKEDFEKIIDHQEDSSNFDDLSDESKEKLLDKKITFQGAEMITLKELNVQLSQLNIDTKTLIKLINDDEIRIGGKLEDLGDVADYYIPRRLRHSAHFDKEKIKEVNDLFVISGTDTELNNYHNINVLDNAELAQNKFQELCDQNEECAIHWLESDSQKLIWCKSHGSTSNLAQCKSIDNFDEISNTITDKIHLEEDLEQEFIQENKHHKIIIISDKAGMGKSTVLTKISTCLKTDSNLWLIRINLNDHTKVLYEEWEKRKKSPNLKFSAADECECECEGECEFSAGGNFLLNHLFASLEHLKLKIHLEIELFKKSLSDRGKIAFLFDGFDEISPDYTDIVIDLLKSLKKTKVEQIFVTTRLNMANALEQSLDAFSYVLEPLSKDEQTKFLMKFWTKKLEIKEDKEERLKIYAKSIVEQISKSINDKTSQFSGNPLQSLMIAEIFQENQNQSQWQCCNEFLKSENVQPELPNKFDLFDLYDLFVQKKFYDWFLKEKKIRDFTKSGEKTRAKKEYVESRSNHELLALCTLFNENEYERILSQEHIQELERIKTDIKNGYHNEGIVDSIINGKPHFIHRSFAEYFASFYIGRKMIDKQAAANILKCIDQLLLNASAIFMIGIINKLDGQFILIEGKRLLHFVIEKRYFNFINSLLESGCDNWAGKLDEYGKTPLHYAIENKNLNSVKELLKNIDDIYEKDILKHGSFKKPEYEKSKLVKFVNIPDKSIPGKIALNYAIQKKDLDCAFELLLKGSNIDSLSDGDVDKLINKMVHHHFPGDVWNHNVYNRGILYVYADQENKYRPIQEKLLLRAPAIFKKLNNWKQSTILSYFFVHGRLKVIKALLQNIDKRKRKKILDNDDNGNTPLDRVIGSEHISDDDRLEITKYLFKQSSFKTNNESRNSLTRILQAAAKHGHIKTFKHFIGNEKTFFFKLHVMRAAENNQRNIIDYFLKKYNRIGDENNTILHLLCDSSTVHLKTIKYLIDEGQNINAANENNETPLFMAIREDSELNKIKYLVSKGADVNWENRRNETPLSRAYSVIDNLLFKRPELKFKVINTKVQIIIQIINFLPEAGISKNAPQPMKDMVAFFRNHNEIYDFKNIEWLNFIVREGNIAGFNDINDMVIRGGIQLRELYKDTNPKDLIKNTPMHDAAENDDIEKVKSLLKMGKSFRAENTKFQTPLDLAAEGGQSHKLLTEISKLFEDIESDNPQVNIKNLKIIQKKYGMDFYIFNICNNVGTLLHNAVRLNELNIVKSLLENGAIYNAENELGQSPLTDLEGRQDIVGLLEEIKKMFGDVRTIERLQKTVDRKIIINVRDSDGQSLLHHAAKSENTHIIDLLKEMGADVNVIDKNGRKYSEIETVDSYDSEQCSDENTDSE